MPSDISRDGFTCAYGRFYAEGRVERIDGTRLKTMFLPRLTPEANKLLREHGSRFVRGQLQHYGVDYDEKELSGNGVLLLKKVLQAGKCDNLPAYIEELQSQMHTEWLEKLSVEELSGHPEWIMEKYFFDGSGKTDSTKTTEVVGIPYPRSSDYRTGQLREYAGRVSGLHQATGLGSTQTIYLGWDQNAVRNAAKIHGAKEAQASKARADAREEERDSKHKRFVANAKKNKRGPGSAPSPVGQYIIDCEEIEQNWSSVVGDITLDIQATTTPGIYQANFDFGVIEGIMMMSRDESALDLFCKQQEHGDDSDSEDDDSEDDDSEDDDEDDGRDERAEEKTAVGSKRKATASKAKTTGGRPPKMAKPEGASSIRKYFLRLKSRDTRTGEIYPTAEKGTIEFSRQDLSSFTGKANMCCIGHGVVFKARKISAVPQNSDDSWEDYSMAAYEYARVNRWR